MSKKATKKKKTVTKKTAKKKVAKKKATKKKVATKKATKKTTKKKAAKKVTKKKAAKKTGAKKATTKKSTAKKAATKKATKKPAAKSTATADLKVYTAQTAIGKAVPSFTLPQTGESTFDLANYKGKKVVIYFYPKDSTPGCTIEGQDFTKWHKDFQAAGAEIFGVSRDSIRSHENFKSKQNYSFELLSDEEEKLCAIFGVIKLKNMYGKKVRGIQRSTFLIGEDGTLLKEWRGVSIPGHAEEVLAAVKNG